MARKNIVKVAKDDVLIAWTVLENLTVSLDQIGAMFGRTEGEPHDPRQQLALQEALATYLKPSLVQAINNARIRLGQYIPDEEAERLAERIGYWEYAAEPRSPKNPA